MIEMHCPRLAELPPPPVGKTGWPWTVETPPLPTTQPDGSPWPRISIVTPSYNQGQFIEETIRSVLLQGYPDLEYIIMDGGSTDGAVDIIRKYEHWLTYWVSEKDQGQSDAINKGVALTSGSIINWINSDDFLAVNALRRIAEAFCEASEDVGAIVGVGHKINANNTPCYSTIRGTINKQTMLESAYGCDFLQPSCFFCRSMWEQCGPIRTDLNYCMDLALWLTAADHYKFSVISTDIAFAHVHPAAKTTAQRKRMFAEAAVLLASTPGGFSWGKRVAMDLVDGKLVSNNLSGKEMIRQLSLKVLSRIGLGRLTARLTAVSR